jgi:hypothetical protein
MIAYPADIIRGIPGRGEGRTGTLSARNPVLVGVLVGGGGAGAAVQV